MGRRSSGGRFRAAPRARTPAPAKKPSAPAPAQRSSIREAFTWGAASSMGHRAMDFIFGPRTINVDVSQSQVPAPAPAPAPSDDAPCSLHNKAFTDCISQNGRDISKCQWYMDMLNQCRRGAMASATTIA